MRNKNILRIMILVFFLVSCQGFPIATPTPTYIVSTKAPEPTGSMIGGEIFGVLDDTIVYIRVYLPDGWQRSWSARSGNGPWLGDIAGTSETDCTVTADAEGFICTPTSYSIRLVGLSAYLVEDGRLTDIEALQLDFHCEPIVTPTVTQVAGISSTQETDPPTALSASRMDTKYYDGIIVISQYYTFLGYGLYAEAYQLLSKSAQSPQSLEDYVVYIGLAFHEVEIVAILPFYVAVEQQGGYAHPDPEGRMRFAVQIRAWGEGGMSGSRLNGDLQELFLELILEDGSWKINTFGTAPLP
jgi:hypothetical protein